MRSRSSETASHGPISASADEPPVSERLPRDSLSTLLWGIDWTAHFPMEIASGVVACASSYDRSLPFVREHYPTIFEESGDSPFATRLGAQKERYYRLAGDFFEFKSGDTTVGLLIGTPVDWSTYYIRSAAVLPAFQRSGLVFGLLEFLLEQLRSAGIERVEADASPSNFATMGILGRLSFNVTGTTLSDRWGAHVRLTRYLDERCEDVFLKQFCSGVRHQRRNGSSAAR